MSFIASLARRNVSKALTASISVSGPAAPRKRTGEKARHGHAVPLVRGARARKLDPILHRLHQRDRIGPDVGLAAGALDVLGQSGRRGRGRRMRRANLACLSLHKRRERVRLLGFPRVGRDCPGSPP